MGKTDSGAQRHAQQSMLLMEIDAPGVKILRHLSVFGYDDAPHGQVVKKRLQDGNASSAQAEETVARLMPLAEAAWAQARLAGAR
jgi:hypothetical protein